VFDSIARYGGEEFVVVLPGTDEPDALATAERLREAIEALNFVCESRVPHRLTVSIGVACTSGRGTTAEALMQASDLSLYEAKRKGRNRIEIAR
jgi:two-component system cell cycle response regulator